MKKQKRLKVMMIFMLFFMMCSEILPTFVKNHSTGVLAAKDSTETITIKNTTGEYTGEYIKFKPSETSYYKIGGREEPNEMPPPVLYYQTETGELADDSASYIVPASRIKWYFFHRQYHLAANKVYYIRKDVYKSHPPSKVSASIMEAAEGLMSDVVYVLANGLHYLISLALGRTVTIDDIIFNHYPETYIAFFKSSGTPKDSKGKTMESSLIYGLTTSAGKRVGGLDEVIDQWYAIFFQISLTGYLVILVYMGIRIILSSTSEKKSEVKRLFYDWVVGVSILFLFPYVMKYIIEMNNAFVMVIEENKGYENPAGSAITTSSSYAKGDPSKIDMQSSIDWNSGTDYMSKMAQMAYEGRKLGISVSFLIMTWQLIILIVHYYKRLFMIAFLIVLFPIVALSYAVDKVADGKSQGLNTWLKEFILNVFVQSFHAIVYVFVCSTVYSAASMREDGTYDFLLIIIGITFLFSGEKIVRQIFGQVSGAGTMTSLGETAAGTYAKFALAKNAIKATASVTVGQKSIGRKAVVGAVAIASLGKKRRALKKGLGDVPAPSQPENRMNYKPQNPLKSGKRPTFAAMKQYRKDKKIQKAAYILSNPGSHSKVAQARALKVLREAAQENPEHPVFEELKFTGAQIAALDSVDNLIQKLHQENVEKEEIIRRVEGQLEYILRTNPKLSAADVDALKKAYFASLFLDPTSHSVSKKQVRKDIESAVRQARELEESFQFGGDANSRREFLQSVRNQQKLMMDRYTFDGMSEEEQKEVKKYSEMVSILNSRRIGSTLNIQWAATKGLYDLLNGNDPNMDPEKRERLKKMVMENIHGTDIDALTHVLSKRIVKADAKEFAYNDSPDLAQKIQKAKQEAAQVANEYDRNARVGYGKNEISIHEVIKMMDNDSNSIGARELAQERAQLASRVAEEKAGINLANKARKPDDIVTYAYDKQKEREKLSKDIVRELDKKMKVDFSDFSEAVTTFNADVKYGEAGSAFRDAKNTTLNKFAENLAIISQAKDGIYSQEKIAEAANYVIDKMQTNAACENIAREKVGDESIAFAMSVAGAYAEKLLAKGSIEMDYGNEFHKEQVSGRKSGRAKGVHKERLNDFVDNMTVISQRDSGVYSEEEILKAIQHVQSEMENSETLTKIFNEKVNVDLDVLSMAVSEKGREMAIEGVRDSFQFSSGRPESADEASTPEAIPQTDLLAEALISKYEEEGGSDSLASLAYDIAILKESGSGVHSEAEVYEAAERLHSALHASDTIKADNEIPEYLDKMVETELGANIDTVMSAISERIVTEGISANSTLTETEANELLSKARNFQEQATVEVDPLDYLVDKMYAVQTGEMESFMSEMAKDYLVENQVELLENHQFASQATIEGYTDKELKMMQINEALKTLSSFNLFKKEVTDNDGINFFGALVRKSLRKEQEEYRGVIYSDEERRSARKLKARELIEENRRKRQQANDAHYYGDIGDRNINNPS